MPAFQQGDSVVKGAEPDMVPAAYGQTKLSASN